MADFSLTTLFVVPVGQTELPSSGSTQDLTAGQLGLFKSDYSVATSADIASTPYFYVAQGRENTYLQGSKRSDKISGSLSSGNHSNVTEWYKVSGCSTPLNQITEINNFTVQCGESVTLTLRAHSSYIDTLYFNGFTRSVTVQAPCCVDDTVANVDSSVLVDLLIEKLTQEAPGSNPDNISFNSFFTFENVDGTLKITGKPLTKYGQPCDVAAFPFEYDRMFFSAFVYEGPATTADFIVSDACNHVADVVTAQTSTFATGGSDEIAQLEKNFYSYQAGYLKSLYRMGGYNENFESYISAGTTYDTYYIKFNEYDKAAYQWGDYIHQDSTVIIAVPQGNVSGDIKLVLEQALGTVVDNNVCATAVDFTTTQFTTTDGGAMMP